MYKEFGKWLMDIAKYLATSVILATFFNGDKNFVWGKILASVFLLFFLILGMKFIQDGEKGEKRHQTKRKKKYDINDR
jgi:hypothetical protein